MIWAGGDTTRAYRRRPDVCASSAANDEEARLITIGISLAISFLAVLIGALLNNKRLDDVKDVVKANMETRAPAKDLYELRVLVEKNHSELLLKLNDIEHRLGA